MFSPFSMKKKGKDRAPDDSTSEHGTPPLPDTYDLNTPPDPPFDPPPGEPDGTGDDDVHNSSYAARCREVMHLYSELKYLMSGLNLKIQLPRVVVIGGQSSGKSSLVEAVSKINVPRDSGTCTRCPMICEISSDANQWSCSISLDIAGTSSSPGEPATPHRRIKFDETTDKAQVELILRRAQVAILNYPDRDYRDFLTKSRDELSLMPRQHDFSENKIVVQLKDPKATDVHFVDLPGLIQNAEGTLIRLIERLTKREIAKPNTIIVIAMPMSDDYQLMQAVKLAQKADPTGQRTLGVLTKPDYLSGGASGSRHQWRLIIEGQNHKTTHGYFCVRLPDDDERKAGKTPAEMEALAKSFFQTQAPWSEMQDEFEYRFGVKNLVKYISPLLMNMIEKNLPLLMKEVDDELAKARSELATLPVLTTQNPAVEIVMRITAFCDEIKDEIFGSQTHKLTQRSRAVYNDFKASIQSTQPRFDPQPWNLTLQGPAPPTSHNPVVTIADVRKEIEETTGWELPGHIPFEATENIVFRHVKPWENITFDCFEAIFDILEKFVEPLKDKHFKPYFYLLAYIQDLVRKLLAESKANCNTMLDKLLDLEKRPIYTWNTDILQEHENQWFNHLHDDYNGSSYNSRSMPTNREELMVMAKVYAYFQVSHRRFVDYAPLMMEHELKQSFVSTLKEKLLTSILHPPSVSSRDLSRWLDDLLREDPVSATRRTQLTVKISTLSQIRSRITAFGVRHPITVEAEDYIPSSASVSDAGSLQHYRKQSTSHVPDKSYYDFGANNSPFGEPNLDNWGLPNDPSIFSTAGPSTTMSFNLPSLTPPPRDEPAVTTGKKKKSKKVDR